MNPFDLRNTGFSYTQFVDCLDEYPPGKTPLFTTSPIPPLKGAVNRPFIETVE
jgi:hypothetical protein